MYVKFEKSVNPYTKSEKNVVFITESIIGLTDCHPALPSSYPHTYIRICGDHHKGILCSTFPTKISTTKRIFFSVLAKSGKKPKKGTTTTSRHDQESVCVFIKRPLCPLISQYTCDNRNTSATNDKSQGRETARERNSLVCVRECREEVLYESDLLQSSAHL